MQQDDVEQSKTPEKPRLKWKRWVLLGVFLVLGPTQYLNHTGFCYAEMRYLNERELVDRFLFGDKADSMSFEEKRVFMNEQRDGAEYPNCCRFEGEVNERDLGFLEMDEESYWFQKTILGLFMYKIKRDLPRNSKKDDLFTSMTSAMDQCGNGLWIIHLNEVTKEVYPEWLAYNAKYWEEWDKENP